MGLASHQRACKRRWEDNRLDLTQAAEQLQPTLGTSRRFFKLTAQP
jgi:hypothetical protein